ncbi:hypothetical protein CU254_14665 [Amycolatopsis sp. AA4]|uniref:hypothetical protein n=1 Tax=Actinomycetes TaxID=1760 RepID=UPI0001B54AD0|nr:MULTISPECIES: hypothetical protein [Actinomycetes]ATY11561.1 hypothetical protein CU254_14665 [Amycolatopsis sp. AA4]EFL07204.1 predicted protein [Streptomyces sp. AA4]
MTSALATVSPKLFAYWATGAGAKKWMFSPHPWTALRDALIKAGVPAREAPGLATSIMRSTPQGRALFKAHHGGTR